MVRKPTVRTEQKACGGQSALCRRTVRGSTKIDRSTQTTDQLVAQEEPADGPVEIGGRSASRSTEHNSKQNTWADCP
jgi:hypothetical protein